MISLEFNAGGDSVFKSIAHINDYNEESLRNKMVDLIKKNQIDIMKIIVHF